MRALKAGAHGIDVRHLQSALNARSRARGLPTIKVDGQYGPSTDKAVARVARALGASESTIRVPGATIGEQRIIRWPATRNPAQRARARSRAKVAALARTTGPHAALRWARAQIGTTEKTGRNDGPKILDWQRWVAQGATFLDGAPYCGIGCANACIRHSSATANARVRWASVGFIEDDARAASNGFTGWSSDPRTARPGDLVVLFGRGVHVELVEKRVPGGVQTIGFNTSPGTAGSQSNGGGVYRRVRPDAVVHGIAHVHYR